MTTRPTVVQDGPNRQALDLWITRRALAGMTPKALAVAAGVSLRTAYRWHADLVAIEHVELNGWIATYVTRRNKPPIRVSEWRRA
jgi:hypothetical protein